MPLGMLEHANLTVSDNDRLARLLIEMCGWHIRWRGDAQRGGETIHVGSDSQYIALWCDGKPHGRYSKGQPLNHVGLVVDDLSMAQAAVISAGLEPYGHDDYDPGTRFYFFDWDGIEFEVVSYRQESSARVRLLRCDDGVVETVRIRVVEPSVVIVLVIRAGAGFGGRCRDLGTQRSGNRFGSLLGLFSLFGGCFSPGDFL